MTVSVTGALPHQAPNWQLINWDVVKSEVKRLQMRIAQAVKNQTTGGLLKSERVLLSA
jgi:hypothetical protein